MRELRSGEATLAVVEIAVGMTGEIGEDSVEVCGQPILLPKLGTITKSGAVHVDA